MPDASVERFRAALASLLGLHCDDTRAGMLSGILAGRALATNRGLDDYLTFLEVGASRDEIAKLASQLTVPETHFFRQVEQLRAFDERVVPHWQRTSADATLRVLVAGCASGEEPYSLAILLRSRFGHPLPFRLELLAIDVSPVSLARARAARYSSWALRETDEPARERWFRREGSDFVLDPSIVQMVTFEERNLFDADPGFWREQRFDVIFFRNVLMYFTPEQMRAVIARLGHSLRRSGTLFLGYAENLRGLSNDFHLCHSHGAFYYQRRELHEVVSETAPLSLEDRPSERPLASAAGTTWYDAIQQASDRVRSLTGESPASSEREPPRALQPDLRDALDLLARDRFDEALASVRALPREAAAHPDALLLRAALLMHVGDFDGATETCAHVLSLDERNAGAHHLLGLCREGVGDLDGAIEHDRKAVGLDPRFAMPHLRLGVRARRRGELVSARQELGVAVKLLSDEDDGRVLLFGGGFRRDALLALCRAELAACERSAP